MNRFTDLLSHQKIVNCSMEWVSNEQCTSTWNEAHCLDNLCDQNESILLHRENILEVTKSQYVFSISDVRILKFLWKIFIELLVYFWTANFDNLHEINFLPFQWTWSFFSQTLCIFYIFWLVVLNFQINIFYNCELFNLLLFIYLFYFKD